MNEKTKHTPGPWQIRGASGYDAYAGKRHVCYTGPNSEDRANASRIVACVNGCEGIADPSVVWELLEALEHYISVCLPRDSGAVDKWHKARAAIAKARGEKGGSR